MQPIVEHPGKRLKIAYDLRAKRAAEMREIYNTTSAEKRSPTYEEQLRFDEAESNCVSLDKQIAELVGLVEQEKREMKVVPNPCADTYEQVCEREGVEEADRKFNRTVPPTMRDRNGVEFRVLAPEHRLTDLPSKEPVGYATLHIGKLIRGLAGGGWDDAEREHRAMMEGGNQVGGYTVSEQMWNSVLDKARARSIFIAAGARTIPMASEVLNLPKVNEDPTFSFKGELEALAESDLTFGMNTLTAHKFGCIVRVSQELLDDSPLAADAIENSLIRGIAASLDNVAINGASPGIDGLLANSNIPSTTSVGAIAYEDLVTAVVAIQAANFQPTAYTISPQIAADLDLLTTGDGATSAKNWLGAPATLNGVMRFVSSTMPDTSIIVGDFSQCVLGVRQSATIAMSREAGTAFEQNAVLIRVVWRGATCVQRPAALHRLLGITT